MRTAGPVAPGHDDPYAHPAGGYDDPVPGDQLQGYGDGPPRTVRRRRRWPKILGGVLVALLVLIVGGYFYLDSRLHRESVLTAYSGRPDDTPGTNWLVVGSDSREGLSKDQREKFATGNAAGRRTDSMMLLHYGSGGTTLLSLPRDLYLPIPGHGSNKLNAAFAFGGPKLLVRTVEQYTRIRIDHYAEIGFGGFVGVVDSVGGVRICIDKPLKDRKAGLNLKPGCQTLNGGQALGFVRTRAFANGDLQRVQNQRKFFAALMDKASSPGTLLNPFRSVPLALDVTSNFAVDDGDHLIDLARLMWAMRAVSGGDGTTTTVPIAGFGTVPGAGSVVRADPARSQALFKALRDDQKIPAGSVTK